MQNAKETVENLRSSFCSGKTLPVSFRLLQLENLHRFLTEKEDLISKALKDDLHKPKLEAMVVEIGDVKATVNMMIKNLDGWLVEKPSVPMINMADGCQIIRDPLGVVLVIGAWNYPVQLLLSPVAGAIAAGNCVVIKPSEVSKNVAAVIAEWLPKYLDPSCFTVYSGGAEETTLLLEERFDHIFYTGSTKVGRIIMAAAAKYLTPVTLELGGKSPCIIDKTVNVQITANRICWGKYMNCGQTCVAPDYLIVTDESLVQPLCKAIAGALQKSFGSDISKSDDYGRIVTVNHHRRLKKLLDDSVAASSSFKIEVGGQVDEDTLYFAPTICSGVTIDSPLMQEEIFGPILPIIVCKNINEAINFVNSRDKPLALYVFTQNQDVAKQILSRTSSGGVCVNDVIMQITVPSLPFGGVGASGMGCYHGKHTFDTFTHRKSVCMKDQNLEFINENLRYPAYNDEKLKWLSRLLL